MAIVLAPGHVDPPPADEQRGGLIPACEPGQREDEAGRPIDWRKGVHAWMENLAGYRLVQACSEAVVEHGYVGRPVPVAANPFVIQAEAVGPNTGDNAGLGLVAERAVRQLRAVTSQALARELWLGELSTQDPYTLPAGFDWANPTPDAGDTFVNPHLAFGAADTDRFFTAGMSPMAALGAVEAATADLVAGGPILIHLPLALLTEVAWSLERVGDTLRTAKGSYVVADSGYPGLDDGAPAGSDPGTWIYGSGPVVLWLDSAIHTYADPPSSVDIATNEVLVRAERDALLLFDPQTVTGCAVTPASP